MAEWILKGPPYYRPKDVQATCSHCGAVSVEDAMTHGPFLTPYCPWCGEQMGGFYKTQKAANELTEKVRNYMADEYMKGLR